MSTRPGGGPDTLNPGGNPGSSRGPDRSLAISLFFLALCVYLLTAAGHIVSEDGTQMFNTTRSLVREGNFSLPYGHAMEGADGRLYCRYGIGQSIAAIPFYSIGLGLATFGPALAKENPEFVERFATSMLNPFIGALAVVVLYRLGRRVGFSNKTSIALALCCGFCTFAWAGAKYFVSETLQGLCMAGALLALLKGGGLDQRKTAAAGLLLGLAFLAKPVTVVVFPVFAACVWLGPSGSPVCRPAIGRVLAFSAPFAAMGLITAVYNFHRFGDPFEFGFSFQDPRQRAFSTPLGTGLYGLLLSSGKSLFLYAPPAVLFLVSIGAFLKRNAVAGVVCLLVPAALVIFYAKWVAWHGDGFWGPRYLLPALPFLLLPTGLLLEKGRAGARRWRRALLATAIAGLLVQSGGVAVSYAAYFREVGAYPYTRSFYDPRFMEDVHFNPAFSPVIGHWKMLVRIAGGREGWEKISLAGPSAQARVPVGEDQADAFRRGLDIWFVHFYRAGIPARVYIWAPFCLVSVAVLLAWRLLVLVRREEAAFSVP